MSKMWALGFQKKARPLSFCSSCIRPVLMVVFLAVKALVRFFALSISIFLSTLLALVALSVLRELVRSETSILASPLELLPFLLVSFKNALIPSVYAMFLSMIVYYGRHRVSPLFSRIIIFFTATGLIYGGFLFIDGLEARLEADNRFSPTAQPILPGERGEILDFGPSALIVLDSSVVEAHRDRSLTHVILPDNARLHLPVEPRSAFQSPLALAEPFESVVAEFAVVSSRFHRTSAIPALELLLLAAALALLLTSYQGLGYLSSWPLANALMCFLLLRLTLYGDSLLASTEALTLASRLLPMLPANWLIPAVTVFFALVCMCLNLLLRLTRGPVYE